jgi:phosphohistidine phosphatase
MKLYVVRHGPAEDQSQSGRDYDRALTPSGRDRVREVAKKLVAMGEAPKAIVSSPLVRALQTAEILAGQVGVEHVETVRELSPGGDALTLSRSFLAAGRRRVMIVGHQPDLGLLVETLLDKSFPYEVMKGMVIGLRLRPAEAARLRFVLDPKTLQEHRSDEP